MNLREQLANDPIASAWPPEVIKAYTDFFRSLVANGLLTVKVGKGGLSFYKEARQGSVFVCHFNAMPQKARSDLGFADFRFDALRSLLDVGQLVETFKQATSADIEVKVHKLWCSIHFPLAKADQIADLFKKGIVSRVG